VDKGAQCILTDSSNSNAQITLIDDIDILKSSVYQEEETKEMFLKILNVVSQEMRMNLILKMSLKMFWMQWIV